MCHSVKILSILFNEIFLQYNSTEKTQPQLIVAKEQKLEREKFQTIQNKTHFHRACRPDIPKAGYTQPSLPSSLHFPKKNKTFTKANCIASSKTQQHVQNFVKNVLRLEWWKPSRPSNS